MQPITTVLLLGGTELMWSYLGYLRSYHVVTPVILSSKRHLEARIEGIGTLREAIDGTDIAYKELRYLNPASLERLGIDLTETIALSFAAPWIVKQNVIDMLDGRIYNLHGTRLPQDRGGATVSWQIMRGNTNGLAMIHRIDVGIDTGEILDYHEFIYDGCVTPDDYRRRNADETLTLLERVTPALLSREEPLALHQPSYLSTYWPRLNTEIHGWIDWSWSGLEILRFVRAFDDPYEGAHTMLGDRTVYLKDCHFDTSDGAFHPFQAGLIYRTTEQYLAVCATSGSLLVRRVFDEHHEPMRLTELIVGDRFFTPRGKLDDALRTRVVYTPLGPSGLTS